MDAMGTGEKQTEDRWKKKLMKEKVKLNGKIKSIMFWPLALGSILAVMDVVVFCISHRAGVVVSLFLLFYLALWVFLYRFHRSKILLELIRFSTVFSHVENIMLDGLVLPFGILDMQGDLIWMNQAMSSLFGEKLKKNLGVFFPSITNEVLAGLRSHKIEEFPVGYDNRNYRLLLHRVDLQQVEQRTDIIGDPAQYPMLAAAYLFDETNLREAIQITEDEKPVLGLIYLDNYEEALGTVEEVRRSLLIALVDRKINKYFSGLDGLVKKLEKDRFFLVMPHRSLTQLKEMRFSILEEVKNINIGNEMAVTLSIGLGLNGEGYNQNYEQSRIAIEMALGRGGDQAVIKDGESISYYGGKSQQPEKATRVKARVKAQALKEFITNKDRVVVMGHTITDVDAFGAAVGIYRAAKTLGKEVHIVISDLTTSIRPLMTGFLESDDYEKDMFIDGDTAKELVDHNTVMVVVDTNKPSYTECPDLLQRTQTIVVLDHHRRGSEVIENAVLSYVEPYASSTCEMVAEILQYFADGIRIRNMEADSLYAGIIIDTNNFKSKAGVRTFEAAAFLRRCGADVVRVQKLLRDNMEAYKARAETICNAAIYEGAYAVAICPSEGLDSPTVVAAQAANELLNIVGVKASFVLTDYHDVTYISARAIDEVNVQVIMEKLGGGGHMNIAGAQIPGRPPEEIVEVVRSMLRDMIEKGEL